MATRSTDNPYMVMCSSYIPGYRQRTVHEDELRPNAANSVRSAIDINEKAAHRLVRGGEILTTVEAVVLVQVVAVGERM